MAPEQWRFPLKAPRQPNPAVTAGIQSAYNRADADYAQAGSNVSQYTPDGNLEYMQYGTWPNGAPNWAAKTTLSPMNQKLYDQSQLADLKMNDISLQQIDKAGGVLNTPFKLGNEAVEGRINELGSKRLDQRFNTQRQQLEQDMMNRGIRPGSEAYNNMTRGFGETQNDAYNELLLNARGQASNELLTERNQPLNEIIGLLNGQQVQQPQFVNTPQTQVAGTDYAGMVADQYKSKNAAYQGAMGGLFGLGGSLASLGGSYFGKK
jgi:hypothetical protein